MRRTIPALALATSAIVVSLAAAQTARDWSPGAEETQQVTRASTLATLAKSVPEVDWEDTPLETIIEWLREQGAVNVVVRWRALQIDGIDPDSEVTLRLRNTTVGQALNYALEQLATIPGDIRYRTFGNALHISTKADFNQKMYVHAYSVADLLRTIRRFTDAPEITLDQQGQGAAGRDGGGGAYTGPLLRRTGREGGQNAERDNVDQVDDERMQELIELITATIEPDSWDLTGGGRGSIRGYNGRVLVARNSIEVHELLGGSFIVE